MIVSITGMVAGNPDHVNEFKKAEDKLYSEGHIVLNPMNINQQLPYEKIISIAHQMVYESDALYCMKGWQNSEGSKLIHKYAVMLKKTIWFEDESEQSE